MRVSARCSCNRPAALITASSTRIDSKRNNSRWRRVRARIQVGRVNMGGLGEGTARAVGSPSCNFSDKPKNIFMNQIVVLILGGRRSAGKIARRDVGSMTYVLQLAVVQT